MIHRSIFHFDFGLVTPVIVLTILGLSTLFSIQFQFFQSQFIFLCISLFFFFVFSQVNYKIIQMYAVPIYIISLILLSILLVLGIESRGAVRWIDIFGIRIQFSEILKPFLAISLASYLSNIEKASFRSFAVLLCLLFPITLCIYLQPDLGNALLYAGVTIFTLFVVGYPIAWFFSGLLFLGVAFPILWRFLREYQRQRILTFFYPSNDPLGTSYNVIQSVIAVGSGMIFGKGIAEVTQSRLRFLPERHTDFIFATFSEGFGFVGTVVMIAAFGFLLFKIYVIFRDSNDRFCKIFSIVSFFLFLLPVFVNIGMNIGIMPVTGVTLPFISYGGSSLVSNFIILGFLSAINRGVRNEDVLEIR